MPKMAKGLDGKRVSSQAPEKLLALAAMLIATAVTGRSTLMEPDPCRRRSDGIEFWVVGDPSLPGLKRDRQNFATAIASGPLTPHPRSISPPFLTEVCFLISQVAGALVIPLGPAPSFAARVHIALVD